MVDFSRLPADMRRLRGTANQALSRIPQIIAEEVLDEELLATPVDTGRARSNWRASTEGRTPRNFIEAHAPGEQLGRGERANYGVAKLIGEDEIREFRVEANRRIRLYNNTPYLGDINQGGSTQNFPGWIGSSVRVGFARARGLLQSIRVLNLVR